jgi:hypothetical protein
MTNISIRTLAIFMAIAFVACQTEQTPERPIILVQKAPQSETFDTVFVVSLEGDELDAIVV